MTPRTIFTIIIKIFGLSMIYGLLDTVPNWIKRIALAPTHSNSLLINILILLLVLIFYFLLMWASLFRTSWIIDKLSLDKDFGQEFVTLKVDVLAVIQIAIIILGGIILIYAIPNLFSDFIYFYKLKKDSAETINSYGTLSLSKIWDNANLSMTVYNSIRIIIGILLLTFSKKLTNWLENSKAKGVSNESSENKEQ